MKRIIAARVIVPTVTVLVLLSGFVSAQQIFVRNYTAANGLLSNDVSFITQDATCRIWIGSALGLESYDGIDHMKTNFSADVAYSVWRSAKGDTLIVGANKGFLYVQQSGASGSYSLLDREKQSLLRGQVTALLYDSKRRLWAGIKGIGLLFIPPERKPIETEGRPNVELNSLLWKETKTYLKGQTINALLETSEQTILIGTDKERIEVPRGDWSRARNPIAGFTHVGVNAIMESRSGEIWYGTERGLYVARRAAVKHYANANGLPESGITSIAEDIDGGIWIGTRSKGLSLFRNGNFRNYSVEDGLASNRIRSLFVDREGNLWVATANGVSKIMRERYETFAATPELNGLDFHCAMKDHLGRMWFGVTGGVVKYDGGRFKFYRGDARLRTLAARHIEEDSHGNLWLNAGTTLARFSDPTFAVFTDSNVTERTPIIQTMENSKGEIWTANSVWLYKVEKNSLRQVLRLPPRVYRFARDHRDDIWMSGDATWVYRKGVLKKIDDGGGTLFLSSDNRIRLVQSEGVVEIDATKGDSLRFLKGPDQHIAWENYMHGVEDRQGRKWFLTSYGIQELRSNALERIQATAVRLGDVHEFGIPEDRNGKFWIPTYSGIVRFNTASGSFATSSRLVALTGWNDFVPGSQRVATDAEGNVWLATDKKIILLYYMPNSSVKPSVYISHVELPASVILPGKDYYNRRREFDRNNPWVMFWFGPGGRHADLVFEPNDTVRVLSNSSKIDFAFKGISFSDENDIRYQHRLDNVDGEWSPPSSERQVSYSNLRDGFYPFRVRAIDANGNISDEQCLNLIVESPFWKMAWFWAYAGTAILYVGGRSYRRRLNSLRRRHREDTQHAILANEMQMARKIQLGMLPTETPKGKGIDIIAKSVPAKEVGGDFYDFAEIADEVYALAVGDVSGHGLTGAMIVGMARTSLRFAINARKNPGGILTLANARIYDDIKRNLFVAVFFGTMNFKTKTLTYTNAGQVMPILCRGGKANFLKYGSGDRFPLGSVQKSRYGEEKVRLRSGDVLLLYTDGIVEAMNPEREEFGFDRLMLTVEELSGRNALEIVNGITERVASHARGVEQQDDLTMVLIKAHK